MSLASNLPPLTTLSESYSYDPTTGEFVWKSRPRSHFQSDKAWKSWNTRFAGKRTGTLSPDGYVKLAIGNTLYQAHRIAYFLGHGIEPSTSLDVDHDNGIRSDNRLRNLRLATRSENNMNMHGPKSNNALGVRSVFLHKQTGKYRARIKKLGAIIELGLHETVEAAEKAVADAMVEHFGAFANSATRR